MGTFELGYLGLFITCFLAATIIPIASEVFLIAMLSAGYDPLLSLFVSTTGYVGKTEWLKKLRVKQTTIDSWKGGIQKYGAWLALLSWLPFIGDVIGIALGFFKASVFWSLLFMLIGKFIRYLCIVIFYLYVK